MLAAWLWSGRIQPPFTPGPAERAVNRRRPSVWQALTIAFASAAGGAGLLLLFPPAPCGNDVLAEVPSPDGVHRAVVFQRDCGATTGFSTQVSVLETTERLKGSGNVFIADTDHGRAPAGPGGGPAIEVRWLAPDTLRVHYDARARVFARKQMAGGVVVAYAVALP